MSHDDKSVNFRIGDLVLYKNNQLIAFNKPAGIPVQPDKTGDKAMVDLAEIYCQSKLHLIHRLDRPASGVVLYAKTHGALVSLNEQFRDREVEKIYLAVVQEPPPSPHGVLIHYVKKNAAKNRTAIYDTEGRCCMKKMKTIRFFKPGLTLFFWGQKQAYLGPS